MCPGSLLLPPSPPHPIPAPSVVAAVEPVLRFVCGPFARLPAHIPPGDPSPHGIAPYLHHLRPHVEGVQPVAEARVAVELRGPLARGHAQLALTLLTDVPEQLRLRGAQDRKAGSLAARGRDTGSSGTRKPRDEDTGLPGAPSAAIQRGRSRKPRRQEERRRVWESQQGNLENHAPPSVPPKAVCHTTLPTSHQGPHSSERRTENGVTLKKGFPIGGRGGVVGVSDG